MCHLGGYNHQLQLGSRWAHLVVDTLDEIWQLRKSWQLKRKLQARRVGDFWVTLPHRFWYFEVKNGEPPDPKNPGFSVYSGDGIGTLTPKRNREVFGFLGYLGGGFKHVYFHPIPGEMIQRVIT